MFKRLLLLDSVSISPNLGRLVLRVVMFLTLFLRHGTEKLFTFGAMSQHFPNPLHIGVVPTLAFAMVSDGICSLLIVVGLATRWAALFSIINLLAAWVLVLHFAFFGRNGGGGETMILYLAACVALFFLGAGKYSIDALIAGSPDKKSVSSSQAGMAPA